MKTILSITRLVPGRKWWVWTSASAPGRGAAGPSRWAVVGSPWTRCCLGPWHTAWGRTGTYRAGEYWDEAWAARRRYLCLPLRSLTCTKPTNVTIHRENPRFRLNKILWLRYLYKCRPEITTPNNIHGLIKSFNKVTDIIKTKEKYYF